LFNEARQKVLDDIDKKRSELEKSLEKEIEIAEKEIQNLNKSSAENIRKIATANFFWFDKTTHWRRDQQRKHFINCK